MRKLHQTVRFVNGLRHLKSPVNCLLTTTFLPASDSLLSRSVSQIVSVQHQLSRAYIGDRHGYSSYQTNGFATFPLWCAISILAGLSTRTARAESQPKNTEAEVIKLCQAIKTADLVKVKHLLQTNQSLLDSSFVLEIINYSLAEKNGKASEYKGMTPLLYAIYSNQQKIVEYFFSEKNADKMHRNKAGYSALLIASSRGHIELVKWLLEKGHAKVDEKDKEGKTALLHAAIAGHKSLVEWLLENGGAKITEKDSRHRNTAYLWAAKNGHADIVEFLHPKVVELRTKKECIGPAESNTAKETALHLLMKFAFASTIKVIEKDEKLTDELTTLFKKQAENTEELVAFLTRKAKLDPFSKDEHNYSPLDIVNDWIQTDQPQEKKLAIKLCSALNNYVSNKHKELKKETEQLEKEREADIDAAIDIFSKLLSERINAVLYTDKAIWEGKVNSSEGGFERYLEIARVLVSSGSDSVAVRVAANLAGILVGGMIKDSRREDAAYIERFARKAIHHVTREATDMVAKRFKTQLWKLSAEGMDDFAEYFCEKLTNYLHDRRSPTSKKIPPLVLELYEAMIDPDKGDSIPLHLRLKDDKTRAINLDKNACWDSRELVKEVGILVKKQHFSKIDDFNDDKDSTSDTEFILKNKHNKYGYVYGNRSDINASRFIRCTLKFFSCHPPTTQELQVHLKPGAK